MNAQLTNVESTVWHVDRNVAVGDGGDGGGGGGGGGKFEGGGGKRACASLPQREFFFLHERVSVALPLAAM